jgi:hypothetical protein
MADISTGMAVACLGAFWLFIIILWIALRQIAGIDLASELRNILSKGKTKEITEQEKIDNNIIELDGSKNITLKKVLSNGSIFKDKFTHFAVRRDVWVALKENEKILEGPVKGFMLRGNELLQALTGNPNIEIEYVDNDTLEAYTNEIGMLKVENANLRASLQTRVESVTQQIIDEHTLRKEETKARHGGSVPQQHGGGAFGGRWNPRMGWGGGTPAEEAEGD